ncbi:SNF2-related protein [Rhodanobacter denitrificans]|uniref:DNA methylase n=1 Tax=Rhodanobacter denitrificans TaxID=666685 RepID=M4NE40_9GAMM|nr:SNF2-related protein [Rhodanobacter denitrificans]AGG89040.1 DNA methylase [Rhodanobacter denitrificans]UJJ53069.1 hypothetical protein LRK52_18355 [Rhodanobacter denitrificans]
MLDHDTAAALPACDPFASRLLALLSWPGESASPTAIPDEAVEPTPVVNSPNYRIPADLAFGQGGPKARALRNIVAIQTLHAVEEDGRAPTAAEQRALAAYVGWGGLPQAFRLPDGSVSAGWHAVVENLEDLLSAAELADARRSTTDAHYTPRVVVEAIYAGLQRLGFRGGLVLEPGCGVGYFLGLMPPSLSQMTVWTTVELDAISAGITRRLYPDATHLHAGFQDVALPAEHFDLALGNPPFGSSKPHDASNRDLAGFTLHNYFVAKSLRALAPGGLLAMVVSQSLMDKASGRERAWLAARAHLLGAIRLPNNTFTANAGTTVTTDIIFLRRALPGETPDAAAWTDVVNVPAAEGAVAINRYFSDHPEMLLGTMAMVSGPYGPEQALIPHDGAVLADLLAGAMARLPRDVARTVVSRKPAATTPPIPDDIPVLGHFIAENGSIWHRQPDVLGRRTATPVHAEGRADERLRGLIDLAARLRAQIAAELDDAAPATLTQMRCGLERAYDRFQRQFGYLNSQSNISAFEDDAAAYLVRALEIDYQRLDAVEAERRGLALPRGRQTLELATKAPILRERVLHPAVEPNPSTAADALAASLNRCGRIDLAWMAGTLGIPAAQVIAELGDRVFRTPEGEWQEANKYLSGNVKAALAAARKAAASDPTMDRNVKALEAVQPADLSPADIHVALGSPWVPASDYAAFAAEAIGLTDAKISLQQALGRFVLVSHEAGHARFGTEKWSAREIFEKALSRETIVVSVLKPDGRTVIDHEASEAARQQALMMQDAFAEWIFADAERRERLARVYNDTFNTDVPRVYDGSHLTFPGKVSDNVICLRRHQVNAAWRMICDGVVLLDHEVGSGKTYTTIAAFMEMRRMGLVRKPLLTVPNALVDQWAQEALRLYPAAKVLAVSDRDFQKDRRKLLFARIATGDWDMVIVAHSQFTRIRVPSSFQKFYLQERVNELTAVLATLQAEGAGRRTVKQAEKAREAYRDRLKDKVDAVKHDDDTASFEDMGIDALAVDEAHLFKNLAFATRRRNVAGLGNPAGSQRAEDLYLKVRFLQHEKAKPSVFFLTGTPIVNSLVEMHVMQRFLATDALQQRGILAFDLWANCYAEESVSFEIDSSGCGLKPKTVLKRFHNLPEMMAIYRRFADTITLAQLKRIHMEAAGQPWPVPKMENGRPENVVVPCGEALERYIQDTIIPRMQAISGEKGDRPDPREDNALKVTNDARLAALDLRLRVPDAEDDPASKVNVACGRIFAIHQQWVERRGTQLVFCDLSTPQAAVGRERATYLALVARADAGDETAQRAIDAMSPDVALAVSSRFSVYDDLRAKLIGMGVAPREIAFIHDAHTDLQRRALFDRVNRGEVRILMGSTSKMGAGMNVQSRLVALHHLDTPWRPGDVTQREGRLLRQGNLFYLADPKNFAVTIIRYVTERTFDSRMWQLQERKSAIIEQMRTAEGGWREVDDVLSQAASAAELKAAATGNPLIIEQVELEVTVKRLRSLERLYRSHVYDAEATIRRLTHGTTPDSRLADTLSRLDALEAHASSYPRDPFTVTVGAQHFNDFRAGANALGEAVASVMRERISRHRVVGVYRGAAVEVDGCRGVGVVSLVARDDGSSFGQTEVPIDTQGRLSASGLMARLDNLFRNLAERRENARAEHRHQQARLADLGELVSQPFRQAAELAAAEARLRVVTGLLVERGRVSTAPKSSNDGTVPVAQAA